MLNYLFTALGVLGVALQVMVLYAMSRGPYRSYPGIFVYVIVLFLTAVADSAAYLDPETWRGWYRSVYFYNNVARQGMGLAAVISLYFTATAQQPKKVALRIRIIAGTAVVIALSFLWATPIASRIPLYLTRVCRNLSFANAVLNLVLWFALIRERARDPRLFIVSGGLGLNMAGEAIGQSLLSMSRSTVVIGNLIAVSSHLLCLLIWWKAFRRSEELVRAPGNETVR